MKNPTATPKAVPMTPPTKKAIIHFRIVTSCGDRYYMFARFGSGTRLESRA